MADDNQIRMMADAFCAGSKPPQNGLEERLDMIAAQLSVIAYELHVINERNDRDDDRRPRSKA